MSGLAIKIEDLSKQYRLGLIGTGTLSHDLNRWWHKIRGKDDPYLKVGLDNNREKSFECEYVWALKKINLEIKKGEILGIVGRNGAGKSTLLKIISKVTGPTTGSIRINGRLASLLEVGTGFHPELTGRENIYLNGAILGMTRKEITGKLDQIVDFAGVTKYVDTPVKRYSSGMMVRLGFAVAAHLEPDILVVDEVLAVGDAEFQKKAIGKMQEVSSESGRTILFVSHNMSAIQTLTTRCIHISEGELIDDGKTTEVVGSYLSKSQELYREKYLISDIKKRHQRLSRDIEFTEFSFENGNRGFFSYGENIVIKIGIKASADIDRFRFSFTVHDISGYPVGSSFSKNELECKSSRAKFYKLTFPALPLAPGAYSFEIAVGKGNERDGYNDFDIVRDILHFHIIPPEGSVSGTISSWSKSRGNTVLPLPEVSEVVPGI